MGEMIPFIGYAPDLDGTLPGVMTNCSAVVPSTRGFKGAPSPVSTTLPTLAGQCQGAASVQKRDDSSRIFAGTATNLYEGASSSWTLRTPSGAGQTLNGLGTSDRWRFAQFQDTTLCTAKTETPKFLTTATTFAAVTTTAPKCAIIETVNNFVMAFDVNDQGALFDSADRPDGWWCAGKGNYTQWTPSITTEAATGTLQSTPGKITAGRRFGYQVVAYKRNSMYVGTYVGQPVIWDFALVPGSAGALSQEAVVNIGTPEQPKHIFMGSDNFYAFDGGRPVAIGNPIRDTVFGELNMGFYYAAQVLHDQINRRVYFWYPTTNSALPDKCVVYNYLTDRWGRDDRTIEAVMDYIATGMTYDALGSSYATYSDLPSTSYDTTFFSASVPVPAVFDTTHMLKTLTGVSSMSSITTGDYGSDQNFTTLSRVRPKFISAPLSADLTHFYRNILSSSLTLDCVKSMSSGRFDLLRSARWHRLSYSLVGDYEISGFSVDAIQDGLE